MKRGPAPLLLAASLVAAGLAPSGCGGGSAPSAPSSTPTSGPAAGVTACGALGATPVGLLGIISGTACTTSNSPVVLVNLRDENDRAVGACSGTVIAPRAVLTAAHCLVSPTSGVKIFLGSGDQFLAVSFHASPRYRENDPSSLDVGVVITAEDLGRPAVPLLLSRDARVGEQAVIAGWGKNEFDVGGTLRAGTTSIAAVGAIRLETRYVSGGSGSGVCGGDSGGPILVSETGVWSVAGVSSAVSDASCQSGTNYFANLRNPDITAFVLNLVPDASRK